jgi:hypothetical protein
VTDRNTIGLFGSFNDPKHDQTALAQLGAAAILNWNSSPVETQQTLLRGAETVTGIPTVGDTRHRLLDMVARNRPTTP